MTNRVLNWYEKGSYSQEQTMERVWDVEDCKNLISLYYLYYNNDMRDEIIDQLWVGEKENQVTASYGSNWGFYDGMEEVKRFLLNERSKVRKASLEQYRQAGNLACETGHGMSICRMVDTPLIYIAEDGESAQGLFYHTGEETYGKPDGSADGVWFYGRVAVDFRKEKDGWKIWHFVSIYDFECPVGEVYADLPLWPEPEEEFYRGFFEAGKPTIHFLAHDFVYHASDGWPQIPCAYETYDARHSFAPEGHPEMRKDGLDLEWETVKCSRLAWGR